MRTASMLAGVAALTFAAASSHAQSTAGAAGAAGVTPPSVATPAVTPPAATPPAAMPSAPDVGQGARQMSGASADKAEAPASTAAGPTGYDVRKAKPQAKTEASPLPSPYPPSSPYFDPLSGGDSGFGPPR